MELLSEFQDSMLLWQRA